MEESPQTTTREQGFRHRAFAEAARYGSDSWVFVRELLQNARDADAGSVVFTVEDDGATERLACRDDGHGMSYAEARRYLFALYASSKEDDPTEAGQFGVGFWSVLRFAPTTITIRSRAIDGPGWQVTVDGALERVRATEDADVAVGTEVVLERPASGEGSLADDVFAAAWHHGRFLRRRDAPDVDLAVTVNGRTVNEELGLPPPCAAFSGKGFRGVVALGEEPKVELFAHGLFVRSAASLRDLRELAEYRDDTTAEDALAELPSMAPQVLLDSSRLDLLLARSDARQSPHLKRMLRAAEAQLELLVTRQLQTLRPQPWYRLWLGALRDRFGARTIRGATAAVAVGLLLGAVALWWRPPQSPRGEARPVAEWEEAPIPEEAPGQNEPVASATATPSASTVAPPRTTADQRPSIQHYSDLSRRYRGPLSEQTRPIGAPSVTALAYEPAEAMPLFNALVVDDVSAASWPTRPLGATKRRYRESRCEADCVDVRLLVAAEGDGLRIPVPSGHRLEASSVRLDGAPFDVFENAHGEAVLLLEERSRGLLEYRTGPAAGPRRQQGNARAPELFHDEIVGAAGRIRALPLHDRVREAVSYVSHRITYRHAGAAPLGSGADFVASAMAAGEGDCDVQNGVLVSLLRAAGVESRLAVGYVGFEGTVAAGAHAWVEYGDGRGRWYTADASVTGLPHFTATAPAGTRATEPLVAGTPAPAGPAGEPTVVASTTDEVSAGAATAPETRSAAVAAPSKLGSRIAVAALLLLAVGGSAALVRRRRHAAAGLDVDEAGDLASLLGGALRHPAAFAGLTALHHGRFVPLVAGRAISLDRARRLANERRLFRSDAGSDLAGRAAARRVPVVDAGTPEGRVLSLALGAIDLDHWSQLLERATESEVSRRLNRILDGLGEPWRLREAPELDQPVVEIALDDLALGRRQVLIDTAHPEFGELDSSRPETAAFAVVAVVLERVGLTERSRARVLAAAAGRAMREAHG